VGARLRSSARAGARTLEMKMGVDLSAEIAALLQPGAGVAGLMIPQPTIRG